MLVNHKGKSKLLNMDIYLLTSSLHTHTHTTPTRRAGFGHDAADTPVRFASS
jgi:hypothetical protein